MPIFSLFSRFPLCLPLLLTLLGLTGCAANDAGQASTPQRPATPLIRLEEPTVPARPASPTSFSVNTPKAAQQQVFLGIDVLEQQDFEAIRGKRVGLLTHIAGVNRRGESTISVLRRAPGVKLVALYAVEHGLYGALPAEETYPDKLDPKTGLMVYSLYNGKSRKATPAQLASIDVLVIDLQDVGTRSYTYTSAMRYALEACFKAGKEVVVLDRPNPLGGLKVDGPLMDAEWMSYVGAFRVPYVHGLTIGELARMAKEAPGVLEIPAATREKGRLTVIPMRGWTRTMRWPDTGLRWIPTSPLIQDFSSVMGYAMTGLGCYLGSFRHGIGDQYPFRGVYHKLIKIDLLLKELNDCAIPGLRFQKVSIRRKDGKPATGIFIEIVDWNDWRPCELSFHLMRLACKYEPKNPFSNAPRGTANGFLRHMGSTAYFNTLKKDGAATNIAQIVDDWTTRDRSYQASVRRYWLYY